MSAAPAPRQAEKRFYPRMAVQIPAIYRSPSLTIDGLVSNIGQGGLFVSCRPDVVGAVGEIVVSLPGLTGPVRLRGRVIWTRQPPQGGMGINFEDLPREHRVTLANFLIARVCS
jgi:uncharacterized protein (TIGR02266 family)